MLNPRRWILWALLVGSVPACGDIGGGTTQTCVAITITYTGSKSGAAYLRVREADGGLIAGNAPSIQVLIWGETGALHCFGRNVNPGDIPFTAAAWIDVSGTGAANCSDVTSPNPQCQPSPSDPQALQSGVERFGQTTQIRLDVVDQP